MMRPMSTDKRAHRGAPSAMSAAPSLPFTETNIHLVAGLACADVRTARRYLRGDAVKGAALREKLAAAVVEAQKRAAQ